MFAPSSVIFISLAVTYVRCYPSYWNSANLNPVHGLFVKPSKDGVTGDLFVAATEDHGVKSQWIVDQPINFLQMAAASQPQTALPLPYPSYPTTHDESQTQKRAAMPTAVPNPPVQYAYALPVPSSENNPLAYPYAYPIPPNPSETAAPKCDPSAAAHHYPFQFPFQFFYPQMMSAYSNALTVLKDAGLSEDTASSVIAQASPMWPPSTYAYPMYVMVDPTTWTQNQSSTTPATTTTSPNMQEESTQD